MAKIAAAKKLRDKQIAFVEHYLTSWNAAEAARKAGYSARTAYQAGHQVLRNPEVRRLIDERLKALGMGADEVLARLSEQAGATMADFIKTSKAGAALDLAKAERAGKLHLIKKFKVGVDGISIELYDAQAALVHLGRHHKLFVDRTEHSGEVVTLSPEELEAKRRARWESVMPALALAAAGDEADPAEAHDTA